MSKMSDIPGTVTSDMKWKYLRENDVKYFDPDRNTRLSDYLDAIFPSEEWVYNRAVDSKIQKSEARKSLASIVPMRYVSG